MQSSRLAGRSAVDAGQQQPRAATFGRALRFQGAQPALLWSDGAPPRIDGTPGRWRWNWRSLDNWSWSVANLALLHETAPRVVGSAIETGNSTVVGTK